MVTLDRRMSNVHRPHNGELVYRLPLVEIEEDGTEMVVPPALICRAKPTTVKDDTLCWVSPDEARRLDGVLTDAFNAMMEEWFYEERESGPSVADALKAAAQEGYAEVGTIYTSPEEYVVEHHVLCRKNDGECFDLVLTHWDEGQGYYLHGIDICRHDMEEESIILRLTDAADIARAREYALICEDENGFHIQVRAYRSVLWQCQGESGIDEDCLRQFWSRQVHFQNQS